MWVRGVSGECGIGDESRNRGTFDFFENILEKLMSLLRRNEYA